MDAIKFPFKPHVYKHDETWSMLITMNSTEQLLRNQEAEYGNRNTENVTSTQTHTENVKKN